LSSVDLSKAQLNRADLIGANLSKANLSDANLMGANLSGAHLNGANLQRADLRKAFLFETHLDEANLRKAYLNLANLRDAHCMKTDLREADLSKSDLRGAYLMEAYLNLANLSEAQLEGTILKGAYLSRAMLYGTIFADLDLRETKGLAEINHLGPSRVELHTIQLPQDGRSIHFLRGTGIPDEWINDYRARMMHPIHYHSCFISHSSKDEMLARRLYADLQDHGVRCWFAPEDLKPGDKIRSRIDEAIHLQDKLLLLLSEHALASSWVEDEVEAAIEKEQQQRREMLFPVRLDESVMQTTQAWATKLRRTRHIGDFTKWTEPKAYHQALQRLLHDLKAEQG